MLYVEQNKGDGGGGDGAEGNSDKDRLWMRMYHFSGEQLHGTISRYCHNYVSTFNLAQNLDMNQNCRAVARYKAAEMGDEVWEGCPLPSRLGDLGERRELPPQGPGPSPCRKRICGRVLAHRTLLADR